MLEVAVRDRCIRSAPLRPRGCRYHSACYCFRDMPQFEMASSNHGPVLLAGAIREEMANGDRPLATS